MTETEKIRLRERLEKEIRATEESIDALEENTKPVSPDNAIGRLSRMEALNSKSVNEAALEDALAKLPRLQNALAKIDLPNFGKCKTCGDDIPVDRLMIVPETVLCMKCVNR